MDISKDFRAITGLKEECGVFGIWDSNSLDLGKSVYYGLYALQHRGQESAGIAVSNDGQVRYHKGMGLVPNVFNDEILDSLRGHMAVGHVRYSTTGESYLSNAQPLVVKFKGGHIALAHNGNLTNTNTIRERLENKGVIFQTTIDSEVIANLIARNHDGIIENAIKETVKEIRGSYALVIMTEDRLIGLRDPNGFRPLVLGKFDDGGYCFASESCALDAVGAELVRDIEPGEMVIIDEDGVRSEIIARGSLKICIFEYIYFARPDSIIEEKFVYDVRYNSGKLLAKEHPVEADIVIAVPDSATPAALGYSMESGIPFVEGLIKNRYIGRTFIQPNQKMREQGVKIKLNSLKRTLEGKRVIMVDDSIVRGTTSKRLVDLVKHSGAKEVHVRVGSSPVKWPCYYGIDTPTRKELLGANYSVAEISQIIGSDTLGYLSIEGMKEAVGLNKENYCLACFNGEYPVKVGNDGKDNL